MHSVLRRIVSVTLFVLLGGCASRGGPPGLVIGEFEDDYGGRFTITASEWFQHPSNRYQVIKWNPEGQYVIARNAAANPSAAAQWARIDWLTLSGMPPYEWAFCFGAFAAPSAAAAEATQIARRDTPRTGCNGFPFSRMRRIEK